MLELVSIIVPVYNVAPYLERCLDSIGNQTYQKFEVILVDDGSTDGSGAICECYAGKDERFRVIHQVNRGMAAARNTGLDCARGEYICFVDSDDYVEKELLMRVTAVLRQGYEIASFCARRVDVQGIELYTMNFLDMIREIDFRKENREVHICREFLQYQAGWEVWGQAFSARLIREHQIRFPENLRYAEDLVFTVECLVYTDNWIKIPDCLYNYTERENSMTAVCRMEQELEGLDMAFTCLCTGLGRCQYMDPEIFLGGMFLFLYRTYFEKMDPAEMYSILQRWVSGEQTWSSMERLTKNRKELCRVLGKEDGELILKLFTSMMHRKKER